MKKTILFLLTLCACFLVNAQTDWKLRYDEVDDFNEDLAIVKLNGKYGFVDRVGRAVIPLKYDFAFPFSDGFASVEVNSKCGYIDKTGREVIPLKYDFVSPFHNGLTIAELNGRYGFIDMTGKEVIPLKNHDNLSTDERFAKLASGGYSVSPNVRITTTNQTVAGPPQSAGPNLLKEEFVTTNYENGTYTGFSILGMKTRYGVFTWNTGDKYIGQWKDNLQNGLGIFLWNNGNRYVGDWNAGLQHGDGAEYDATGKLVYYGKYDNGKYLNTYPSSGYSSYKFEKINYTSGDYYEGETKNGIRDGFGVYYWQVGGFWFGRWENGERNGFGVFFPKDGVAVSGKWIGDQMVQGN